MKIDYKIVDRVIYVYLIVVLVGASHPSISEILRGFIGATLLFLLPYVIGRFLMEVTNCNSSCLLGLQSDFIIDFMFCWFFGSASLFILAIFLSLIGFFSIFNLTVIILMTVLVSLVINFLKKGLALRDIDLSWREFILLILIMSIGWIATLVYRLDSPFPYQPNWDMFQDLYIAGRICEFGEFHIQPQEYAPYYYSRIGTTMFDLLLALSAYWSHSEQLSIYWCGPFLYNSIYGLLLYLWVKRVTGRTLPALITAFVSVFIFEYNPVGLMQIRQDRLLVLAFPYLMVLVDNYVSKTRNLKNLIAITSIYAAAILLHPYTGSFIAAILTLFLLTDMSEEKIKRIIYGLLPAIAVLVVVMVKFQMISLASLFVLDLTGSVGLPPASESFRLKLMETWYSPLVFGIFLAGLLVSSYHIRDNLRRYCFLASLLLILYYSPIIGISRVALFIHPFIAFFAVLSIEFLARGLSEALKLNDVGRKRIFNIIIVFFLVLSLPMLIASSQRCFEKTKSMATGFIKTSFTEYELEMSLWIKENTPRDALLVSDLITQEIIMGLSLRESFGKKYFFPGPSLELLEALKSNDTRNIAETIYDILPPEVRNRKVYLIVSGRLEKWLESENPNAGIWGPKSLEDLSLVTLLMNSPYFRLVHSIDNKIFLFEVKKVSSDSC